MYVFRINCAQKNGGIVVDVSSLVISGWMKCQEVTGVSSENKFPLKVKRMFNKTVASLAIMYGSECWEINEKKSCKNEKVNMWWCDSDG